MTSAREFTLTLSAGTGPIEVRRFVAQLARALIERVGDLGVELVTPMPDETPARSLRLRLRGDRRVVAAWAGTHVLVADTRRARSGRHRGHRKRWFVLVSITGPALERLADATPALDPREVEIRCCRAGGPGGQHVNTTATAVHAVHRPTGVRVRVADSRSQADNRRVAIERLADALARAREHEHAEQRQREHARALALVRGDAVHAWRLDARGRLTADADQSLVVSIETTRPSKRVGS